MFDWNDEELTNIIWGEAGESDDHIVPYPDSNESYCKKKEWVQESSIINSTEQKAPGSESELHTGKLDGSPNFDPGEGTSSSGLQMDSWSNLSLSSPPKADKDTLGKSVSENLPLIYKFNSQAETSQLGKDSGIFQNPNGGKEQDDFVDYGWDGSFDDLDRIFSTDDPIFGNVNLGNADELWSSKDITNSQVKSFADSPSLGLGALRDGSEHFDIKGEYMQEDDQAFTLGYGNDNDTMSNNLPSTCALSDHLDYAGGDRKPIVKDQKEKVTVGKDTMASCQLTSEKGALQKPSVDKGYKQNKLLKGRKKYEEKNNLKLHQDLYGNWSSSGPRNPYSPQAMQSSPSSVISQERQLHGTEPLFYQPIPNPYVPPSTYGNVANPYSAMPVLPHIQSTDNQQPILSGYEVPLDNAKAVNNTTDSPIKYPTLTPQEKIEKLRRRQQMQAMLAIRKQQQQFVHDISCSDPSISHCSQENQIHQVDGGLEVEDPGSLAAFDPNSPGEQDDSNTTSLAVNDYSAEDAILHRLQEVVAKLDVRVRLCIRDSLYRLAQSATQRHFASDTSSTNNSSKDDHAALKEDNNGRNVKMPEVETESNPIDRTVAHLLFHRPMELSAKRPDTPESPASAKLQSEHKMARITKSPMECSPRNLKDRHGFSLEGSRSSSLLSDLQPFDQGKTSFCIDTSENASNTGPPEEPPREVEASQRKDELRNAI